MLFMCWDRMAFASTQYTIIIFFFPLLGMQEKLPVWSLYTMPSFSLIPANMKSHFSSWLGCMSYYVSVTGVGVTSFFVEYFLLLVQVVHVSGQGIIEGTW